MEAWKAVYTERQREVLQHAFFVLGITNRAQIHRLALAGELTFEGEPFPAYKIPYGSVVDIISKEERRREGRHHTALASKPPEDAVEQLRRRLISLIDTETLRLEKHAKTHRTAPIDAEQIRKLARATRELDALPGPGQHSTKRPPGRDGKPGEGVAEPSSIAGGLMQAMKAPGIRPELSAASRDVPTQTGDGGHDVNRQLGESPQTTTLGEIIDAETNQHDDGQAETDDGDPGAFARAQLGGLRALDVSVTPAP